jgi:hypothetical protein
MKARYAPFFYYFATIIDGTIGVCAELSAVLC